MYGSPCPKSNVYFSTSQSGAHPAARQGKHAPRVPLVLMTWFFFYSLFSSLEINQSYVILFLSRHVQTVPDGGTSENIVRIYIHNVFIFLLDKLIVAISSFFGITKT